MTTKGLLPKAEHVGGALYMLSHPLERRRVVQNQIFLFSPDMVTIRAAATSPDCVEKAAAAAAASVVRVVQIQAGYHLHKLLALCAAVSIIGDTGSTVYLHSLTV